MQFVNLKQGSPEWLQWRAELNAHNASEAPVAAGASTHVTRGDLLRMRAFGGATEYTRFVQERVLDRGHRIEAKLRPIAEAILQQQMFPAVGTSDDGYLRASFDGLGMLEDESFEAKSLNDALRAALPVSGVEPSANDGARLPLEYRIQCQQQLMVRGQGMRVLFIAGEEHSNDVRCCWYMHDAQLAQQILGVWKQWDADLDALARGETETPQAPDKPAPEAVEALPVLSVRMEGALTISDNLDRFGEALRAYVARIPKKPSSDQEFANCEDAVKRLGKAEEALKAEEAKALASVEDVQRMREKVDALLKVSADARKAVDALVKRRKTEIREEHCTRGRTLLQAHLDALDRRMGGRYMPAQTTDWAGAIRNLKKWDSLREAIDTTLALAKVAASQLAEKTIEPNLQILRQNVPEVIVQKLLFGTDLAEQVRKPPADFQAILEQRLSNYRKAQQASPAAQGTTDAAQENTGSLFGEPLHASGYVPLGATPGPQSTAGATNASNVVPMPQAGARAPLTPLTQINRGQIRDLIAPLEIDSEGLATLGFPFIKVEKGSKLYYREDVPAMCTAMIRHLERVRDSEHARAMGGGVAAGGGGE